MKDEGLKVHSKQRRGNTAREVKSLFCAYLRNGRILWFGFGQLKIEIEKQIITDKIKNLYR